MANAMKVFTGTANVPLAERIAEHLGVRLGEAIVDRFADGEVRVKIQEDVRGADVFVVQSTCPPVNDSVMELALLMDALRRASAERITAVRTDTSVRDGQIADGGLQFVRPERRAPDQQA